MKNHWKCLVFSNIRNFFDHSEAFFGKQLEFCQSVKNHTHCRSHFLRRFCHGLRHSEAVEWPTCLSCSESYNSWNMYEKDVDLNIRLEIETPTKCVLNLSRNFWNFFFLCVYAVRHLLKRCSSQARACFTFFLSNFVLILLRKPTFLSFH